MDYYWIHLEQVIHCRKFHFWDFHPRIYPCELQAILGNALTIYDVFSIDRAVGSYSATYEKWPTPAIATPTDYVDLYQQLFLTSFRASPNSTDTFKIFEKMTTHIVEKTLFIDIVKSKISLSSYIIFPSHIYLKFQCKNTHFENVGQSCIIIIIFAVFKGIFMAQISFKNTSMYVCLQDLSVRFVYFSTVF